MIPEGWKLVPIEPTIEMEEAGAKGSGEDSTDCALGAWKAMLAAAPEPPLGVWQINK